MPKSKTYLPDVNVWLALATRRHVHWQAASDWLESVSDGQAAFCRITQMGLLRLLTNRNAMAGDVLSQAEAWRVYWKFNSDPRITFKSEPTSIETAWHELTRSQHSSPSSWTDAYLQAFSRLGGLQVVSFDTGFLRFDEPKAIVLT